MRENAGNSRCYEETRQAFRNSGEVQTLVAILTFQKCPFFLVWKALPFLQCSTTNIWYKEFFVRRLSENLAKVETSRPGTVVVGWTMVCLEKARVKGSGMPFM